jgi:hypothetical protein
MKFQLRRSPFGSVAGDRLDFCSIVSTKLHLESPPEAHRIRNIDSGINPGFTCARTDQVKAGASWIQNQRSFGNGFSGRFWRGGGQWFGRQSEKESENKND